MASPHSTVTAGTDNDNDMNSTQPHSVQPASGKERHKRSRVARSQASDTDEDDREVRSRRALAQTASQRTSVGDNTNSQLAANSARTAQHAATSLLLLPTRLLELVLQHLTLAEQLSHSTRICKPFTPPTPNSIRYATLLLNEDTVWHISQSPRIPALLSAATSVVLQLDNLPPRSRALQFVLGAPNVDVLFPRLAHFSYQLCPLAVDYRATPAQNQFSLLPLLPFLSARSVTLHSLHLFLQHMHGDETLSVDLPPLLAPLTALRRLRVDRMTLSLDVLPCLLSLPLASVDLSTCLVSAASSSSPSPPVTDVAECALLRSCRVLRLPRYGRIPPCWKEYIDALVTHRSEHTHLHTLSV